MGTLVSVEKFEFEKHKTPLQHRPHFPLLSKAFIRRSEAKANAFTLSFLPFLSLAKRGGGWA